MATALILAPAGCSLGADEEPQPATGAPREIGAVVQRLERAIARRDLESVCENLFTAGARQRAGGADCPRLLRSAARAVRDPRIEVRAIDLEGDAATVRVRTGVRGRATVGTALRFRRERGEWRIDGLGG
jgi:hypothetical protein